MKSLFAKTDNLYICFYVIMFWSEVTYDQVWWSILGICALRLTHPKCTHTAVNTHPDQWAAIYAAAPGEQLGVRWLAQGHLVVVLKVERALYIHSPHLQFLQARDSNSQPFDYESETLTIIGLNFPFIELVNNNPTAYWLRLIGMHNEKTWFLKMVKIWVICFCKWTLHIYIYIYIYTHIQGLKWTLAKHQMRVKIIVGK